MARPVIKIVVIGRTGLWTKSHQIETDEEQSIKLYFIAEDWMVPEAQIIAFYVHFSGEIIFDYLPLVFDEELTNEVCLKLLGSII